MNLPEYSLRSAKVIWFFLAVLLAGGALGFATLGKKEDAVFVIKSASLVCSYPGATPQQVEELVTEPIEREVQSMRRVHKITSESYYGLRRYRSNWTRPHPPPKFRNCGTNCAARCSTSSRACPRGLRR